MTSFVCSLLVLIFMFSSIRATVPTALKVRITNHALNMLRDEAESIFLEQVAGTTFEGPYERWGYTITNVTVTEVNIYQAHLQFKENYGFRFMVKDFGLTLNFYLGATPTSLALTGLSATVEFDLKRNENGRLAAKISTFDVSSDRIQLVGGGITGGFLGVVLKIVPWIIPYLSPWFRGYGQTFLDRSLESIPMVVEVFPDLGIKVDYSLTRDIQVTATSLDVSFKGQVYIGQQPPPIANDGIEPVLVGDAMMAYVGISEFFFNSAARTFYEAGLLKKPFNPRDVRAARFLRMQQLFTNPWNLDKRLEGEMRFTEAPTIKITQTEGFTFNVRIKVMVKSPGSKTPDVFSSSAVCRVSMMVTIVGNRLSLPFKDVKCRLQSKNAIKPLLVPVNKLLNSKAKSILTDWFAQGVEIPWPEELNFIQGETRYENGFVVVGGSLRSNPAGRQRLFEMVRGAGRS